MVYYSIHVDEKLVIDFLFLHLILYRHIVDLHCCVSFRCTAKGFSYTYTYIYYFSDFSSQIGYYRILGRVPVLYNRILLVIYSIYSSVYILILTF